MPAASTEELLATVARMEARLFQHPDPQVQRLVQFYRELVPRFESDLAGSERDIALARSAALMVLQAAARRAGQEQPP